MDRRSDMLNGRVAAAITIIVLTALVAITPFVAVLEVHHLLAAADADGHEHSDTDLCQWVQHHAGTSLQTVVPTVASAPAAGAHEFPKPALVLSFLPTTGGPARAPPIS